MEKFRSCYEACRDNDVEAVRQALEEGFVDDSCDGLNNTLLHVSARYGRTEIVSLLLEHMADVNVQNKHGDTPLHVSVCYGRTEIVSLLLEYKADVNVRNMYGYTPLYVSAEFRRTEIVSLLLEHKADVNVQNNRGHTPLHWSALTGHKNIVSLLLANMDNVNVKDIYGFTPLHLSAAHGYKEIFSMLLSKNADVNVQDKDGCTPLHKSAKSGHTEIVSLLLENKADVNIKCAKGLSPLDYADNEQVADVLVIHDAFQYKQSFMGHLTSLLRFIVWSKTSTTTTSVKVTVPPGVEDNKDISASTSFSHTQTIERKDEVTNTIRNDETTSDSALMYENTDQHKISGPETISTSEECQVLGSVIARDIEQVVANRLKEFPGIISTCMPSISSGVSTTQQNGAQIVNIINITVNNEINISDIRDMKCKNANINKSMIVANNSQVKVVNSPREACTDDEDDDDDESDDEAE